jgi:hypothetical protein
VTPLGLVLAAAGLGLILVAVWLARAPLATIRHLDATEANLKRYDAWRGGRRTLPDEVGTTGADVMRAQLRRRLGILSGVGIVGGVLVVLGLMQR